MMITHNNVKKELKKFSSSKRKESNEWFFKTGPGEYGEGDRFIGVSMPHARKVAKEFKDISFTELKKLFSSKIHEERMVAHVILVLKFEEGNDIERKRIYNFYLKNTKYINNWDFVDTSAHKIVGVYLWNRPVSERKILKKLAKSKNMWERRISIVATATFIHNGRLKETLEISKILLHDKEDLIHKAVGWMLREVGKKSLKDLEGFLKKHYSVMPRTMLRYAIEKFPEKKRQAYLQGTI